MNSFTACVTNMHLLKLVVSRWKAPSVKHYLICRESNGRSAICRRYRHFCCEYSTLYCDFVRFGGDILRHGEQKQWMTIYSFVKWLQPERYHRPMGLRIFTFTCHRIMMQALVVWCYFLYLTKWKRKMSFKSFKRPSGNIGLLSCLRGSPYPWQVRYCGYGHAIHQFAKFNWSTFIKICELINTYVISDSLDQVKITAMDNGEHSAKPKNELLQLVWFSTPYGNIALSKNWLR